MRKRPLYTDSNVVLTIILFSVCSKDGAAAALEEAEARLARVQEDLDLERSESEALRSRLNVIEEETKEEIARQQLKASRGASGWH